MGRYSGILLCTDFDGTLHNGKEIPENNLKALKHFTENGGLFAIASGRAPDFLKDYADMCSVNAPCMNVNGAVIYDLREDKIIEEGFVEGLCFPTFKKLIDENPEIERFHIFRPEGTDTIYREDMNKMDKRRFCDIYKITFRVKSEKEESDRVKARMETIIGNAYEITRSAYHCIELISLERNKGKATQFLKKYLGADKLVCVGDFENDIPMVRDADVGYAVANATDALKAVADKVTVSVHDGALAAIIEEL